MKKQRLFNSACAVVLGFVVCVNAEINQESSSKTGSSNQPTYTYTIVDTGQIRCYDNTIEIQYPKAGAAFFGQDAHYNGNQPSYKDNGDGTITDLNTALMWQQDPGPKKTFQQALDGASKCKVGGYDDWRLPTIKELYSLILFNGTDPDPMSGNDSKQKPFIDNKYFNFKYGDLANGERIIDSQFATSTKYVSTTMRGDETVFGVNFADGRIKGYGLQSPRTGGGKTFYVLYVRGNKNYGKNDFKDNGDGTITDKATGLIWMKVDSGKLKAGKDKDGKMNWGEALEWSENLEYAGYCDWRLPNVKELQSLVDYTRSPDTTNSAAIDSVFQPTAFKAESGKDDYPNYWTGTTHASISYAGAASYVAFGRSFGWMQDRRTGRYELMDVHGAGSQRSDPKSGDPSKYPHGRGPQGDVLRINNFVLCVRGGIAELQSIGPKVEMVKSNRQFQNFQPLDSGRRPMGQGPSGEDFVKRLDRNGDGKISKSEFDGPAQHFNELDQNNDGYLSVQEAPQGPPQKRR
ncbi:MAG: DUF1566 domain-containing protein [Phycisphaerae bacterium]|nr:DUF1566 domain-containing protein [Phycisphaerae bacterium]